MIFIFGFEPREKTIGPVNERTCPKCNNKRFWLLKTAGNWFSLFFIPIIPYNKKYFVQCPICGESETVSTAQFEDLKKQAELNNEALADDLSADEYEERLNRN